MLDRTKIKKMTLNPIYMQRCIQLARKGEGFTNPNPMVGAVIVHNNRIIGEGYHRQHGTAHGRGHTTGRDKVRFESAPFQGDGSLAGPRQRERSVRKTGSIPARPLFLQDSAARRERDPGPMAKPGVVPGWGREPSRNAKIPITLPFILSLDGTPERRGRPGGIRGFTEQ